MISGHTVAVGYHRDMAVLARGHLTIYLVLDSSGYLDSTSLFGVRIV